jgi:hypothetical protein
LVRGDYQAIGSWLGNIDGDRGMAHTWQDMAISPPGTRGLPSEHQMLGWALRPGTITLTSPANT